jgi:hypothetical protein
VATFASLASSTWAAVVGSELACIASIERAAFASSCDFGFGGSSCSISSGAVPFWIGSSDILTCLCRFCRSGLRSVDDRNSMRKNRQSG